MVEMSLEDFENAVGDALDLIPQDLMDHVDNCVILVEEEPPDDVAPDTLGLYDGVPLTERDNWWGGSLPDRIFIYRGPLMRMCESTEELIEEITVTVIHEIAHHFGIEDDRLHELGWD
ncbi:Predicted Zn-dependent protease, minimal metalloprotease (MMP)-like domain [Ruaniaceae bacterium KH17]|nr:Predicted Zn-dependent protease, minimal metalloprotease (MMP)-like domain [Ruaniaceae bacterium KH17]